MTRVCVDASKQVCLSLDELVEGGDMAIIDSLTCTFVKMNLTKEKVLFFHDTYSMLPRVLPKPLLLHFCHPSKIPIRMQCIQQ